MDYNQTAPSSVLSPEIYSVLLKLTYYFLRPCAVLLGIFASALNVTVFSKLGLKDSVAISFFALSLSDLFYLLISSAGVFCRIIEFMCTEVVRSWVFDPMNVTVLSYWHSAIFYDTSMMITAFIAVVRCCLVAIPLHFKGVFTRSRTLTAIICIVVTGIFLRLPILSTMYLEPIRNRETNITQITFHYTKERELAVVFTDVVNRNVVPWICAIIIFFCFMVLAKKLMSSSRFRLSNSLANEAQIKSIDLPVSASKKLDSPPSASSSKDLQIIKSVAFVSALFLVMALPFMISSLVRLMVPGFRENGKYENVFGFISIVNPVFGYSTCFLNTLIYYNVNSKFRLKVQSMFAWI